MAEEELSVIGPAIAGALPNRRVAEVSDCAHAALFLASDAGKHISGQAISVCGGVRYLV